MMLIQHSKGYGKGFYPPSEVPISNFDDKDELKELILDRILDLYFFHCVDEKDEAEEKDEFEEHQDKLIQAINYEVQDAYPKGFNTLFEVSLALLRVHRRYKVDEEDEEDDEEEDYIGDGEMYDPAADSQRGEDYGELSELDRELLRAEKDLVFEDTPL